MTDLQNAKNILASGDYTCVICKNDIIYTSNKKGVSPIIDFLDNGTNLKGFTSADRIIGKGVAMLYALLEVKEVYSNVISKKAIPILEQYNIKYSYDILTDNIINRMGNDICPIEKTVKDISLPLEGLQTIKNTLEILKSKNR